jgi:general secretion pathway protein G
MFRSKLLKSQKGMTLIEIVIVVTILATLAAVLISAVKRQRDKAMYNQTKLQMGNLDRAMQTYYTDCNKFPNDLNGLLQKDDCANWGPEPYVKNKNELKDSWGTEFIYSANGSNYELKSLGSDKKEGGEGYGTDLTNADQ